MITPANDDAVPDDDIDDGATADDTAADLASTLDEILCGFVQQHGGMRQHDQSWHSTMGVTVGGSELAALLGKNPYSDFYDVVESKLATLAGRAWAGGGAACWWGTLFEDTIAAYTAADLGSAVRGDDICIRMFPGHRNSPDGYLVARLYRGADDALHLWTTDMPASVPTLPQIALLEFKCPLSRRPTGSVPRQYRPQVWSGLAVSPVASFGIFIEGVFRKCAFADLGDSPGYDTAYHRRRNGDEPPWAGPVACGLIGVYAPAKSAPRRVRLGWKGDERAPGDPPGETDAATVAATLAAASAAAVPGVADLGAAPAYVFERALGLIDGKRFPIRRGPPCFVDGRGPALRAAAAVVDFQRTAPPDHTLFAVLPWKLFDIHYHPVERRPGFMDEVAPLIREVHRTVAEARAAADPAAFLAAKKAAARAKDGAAPVALPPDAVQSFFDSLA